VPAQPVWNGRTAHYIEAVRGVEEFLDETAVVFEGP